MAVKAQPSNAQSIIWECLNAERWSSSGLTTYERHPDIYGPLHADPDMIGLRDVAAGEITPGPHGCVSMEIMEFGFSDGDAVSDWLKKPAKQGTCLRLLISTQAAQNDALRPPMVRGDTHISKSLLAEHLHIPSIAVEKLGLHVAYAVTYPPLTDQTPAVECHSIVTNVCSAAWSYDRTNGINKVFVVLFNTRHKKRILDMFELLKDCSYLPSFVPFILLESHVDAVTVAVSYVEQDAIDDHRQVLMGLAKRQHRSMFDQAAMRFQNVAGILKHSNNVLTMGDRVLKSTPQRLLSMSDDEWSEMESRHESMQQLISFKFQELQCLVAHAEFLRGQVINLKSEVTGLMSFNQQETSKLIAERTKADGTSMKTLSVIAALYLPTTAIAAIFSMPVFNWNANLPAGTTVNPKIWIFFAFAIPLTLMTMTFFWAWVKWENEGPVVKIKLPSKPRFSNPFHLLPGRRKPQKHVV